MIFHRLSLILMDSDSFLMGGYSLGGHSLGGHSAPPIWELESLRSTHLSRSDIENPSTYPLFRELNVSPLMVLKPVGPEINFQIQFHDTYWSLKCSIFNKFSPGKDPTPWPGASLDRDLRTHSAWGVICELHKWFGNPRDDLRPRG